MKARVKATGEIIDVIPYNRDGFAYIQDDGETVYEFHELEILEEPDYWDKLLHQYAGMAMQAYIIASHISQFSFCENDMKDCVSMATALVNKLKGE